MQKLVEEQFMPKVTSIFLYHIRPLKTIMHSRKVQNSMGFMVTSLNLLIFKYQDLQILLQYT